MKEFNFKLNNYAFLHTLVTYKSNLLNSKPQHDIVYLVNELKELFPDVPSKANIVHHDADGGRPYIPKVRWSEGSIVRRFDSLKIFLF